MNTIWKYPLEITDDQLIEMPLDAKILTAQVQNGILCLWVIVNPENKRIRRHIQIYGTGHNIFAVHNLSHISTIQLEKGKLIFHVFEKVK